MAANEIKIYISQYDDDTYCLEAKHMHYAFDDHFNFDDIAPEDLGEVMRFIDEEAEDAGISVVFKFL